MASMKRCKKHVGNNEKETDSFVGTTETILSTYQVFSLHRDTSTHWQPYTTTR